MLDDQKLMKLGVNMRQGFKLEANSLVILSQPKVYPILYNMMVCLICCNSLLLYNIFHP